MAELKDASLWVKLIFLLNMVGFTCDLFGFAIGYGSGGDGERGAHIVGFLCWLVATVLILVYVFLDECNGNKVILIIFVVLAFIAGIATVIGIALWGGRVHNSLGVYSSTVACSGGLLEILAAIFGILELVGVQPK